jgi:Spy/CpxP family protein refolding chaperone
MKVCGLKSIALTIGILVMSFPLAAAQPVTSAPPFAGPSEQTSQQQMQGKMKAGKMQMMPMMKHDMHKMMPGMMGRKMDEMKRPAGPGMQHPGMGPYRAGMDSGPFMASFHRWIGSLMAQRGPIELTSQQINQLDELVSKHLQSAIRGHAEIRALQVELKRVLRGDTVDMQSVEAILGKISRQELDLQVEGFRMYRSVLDALTPDQRQKARDLIGNPFPAPWEEMTEAASSGFPGKTELEQEEEQPAEGHEGHQ